MSIFHFKQFGISHKKASAKVGTDGVLLGAWSEIPNNCKKILDIGSGSGLIALMLAQRTKIENSEITAIEIEKEAFNECNFNFSNSPWHDRLKPINIDFNHFETTELFDLIVCNPPFYTTTQHSERKNRALARNNEFLPFTKLLPNVNQILQTNGLFSLIIPFSEETNIINLAEQIGLYPNKITNVKGNINAPYKRSLICFSKTISSTTKNELIIEKSRSIYTQDYINLTKDFYLNF